MLSSFFIYWAVFALVTSWNCCALKMQQKKTFYEGISFQVNLNHMSQLCFVIIFETVSQKLFLKYSLNLKVWTFHNLAGLIPGFQSAWKNDWLQPQTTHKILRDSTEISLCPVYFFSLLPSYFHEGFLIRYHAWAKTFPFMD